MGIFEFTWPHPAGEVYITGTFDQWKGTIKLHKDESGQFKVFVDLGDAERVYYKYIVDGHWTVNYDAKREYDNSGNENNVLYPEDLRTPTPSIKDKAVSARPGEPISGLDTPPMLTPDLDDIPGGFPETPAQEEPEVLSVSPLPACTTAGNPITLPAGEPVPDVIPQSVEESMHLDKESYEKADASNFGVTSEAPVLPPVVTPADEREAKGTGVLDVPEITFTETKAEEVTETTLPEPQQIDEEIPAASVPEIVKESQAIAHTTPEASASEDLVEKKAEVEQELLAEVEEEEPIAPVVHSTPVESTIKTAEPENLPSAIQRSVSPPMSPITTPAAATTHVYSVSVPGATFKAEPAPSTKSSSASSHESHNEKRELFRERTPEKKKEKRRSVILGRILNLFK